MAETTIHNVARITMQTVNLTRSERPRYSWVAHKMQFRGEDGKVLHEVTVHGLDGEAPITVTTTKED